MPCACNEQSDCYIRAINTTNLGELTYVEGISEDGCLKFEHASNLLCRLISRRPNGAPGVAGETTFLGDDCLNHTLPLPEAWIGVGSGGITVANSSNDAAGHYGHRPTFSLSLDNEGIVSAGLSVTDTDTVNLSKAGASIYADVIVSPNGVTNNALQATGTGLFVPEWVGTVGDALTIVNGGPGGSTPNINAKIAPNVPPIDPLGLGNDGSYNSLSIRPGEGLFVDYMLAHKYAEVYPTKIQNFQSSSFGVQAGYTGEQTGVQFGNKHDYYDDGTIKRLSKYDSLYINDDYVSTGAPFSGDPEYATTEIRINGGGPSDPNIHIGVRVAPGADNALIKKPDGTGLLVPRTHATILGKNLNPVVIPAEGTLVALTATPGNSQVLSNGSFVINNFNEYYSQRFILVPGLKMSAMVPNGASLNHWEIALEWSPNGSTGWQALETNVSFSDPVLGNNNYKRSYPEAGFIASLPALGSDTVYWRTIAYNVAGISGGVYYYGSSVRVEGFAV